MRRVKRMHSFISSSDPALASVLTSDRARDFAKLRSPRSYRWRWYCSVPRCSHVTPSLESARLRAGSVATNGGNVHRAPAPGSPPTVLLVGNSLLLARSRLSEDPREMAPDARVLGFVIENTEYLDWYYGLRHLFASGVRPSTVVLCLNLGQTVSSRTLGDYSARHLFGVSDLLPVAHDAGMDATRTSGLVLAHWSAFYASRAITRTQRGGAGR